MVRVVGESGPSVLLLPGGAEAVEGFFPEIVDALAQSCRVVLFDRPGVQGSGVRGGLSDAADAVHVALHEAGAAPSIVIGQSLGGAVALLHAQAHPCDVAGLVLLDPTPIEDVELCAKIGSRSASAPRFAKSSIGSRLLEGVLSASARSSARRHAMTDERRDAMLAMARTDLGDLSQAAYGLEAAARSFDSGRLPHVPAVVISADRKPSHPVRRAHERLGAVLDAQVVIWPRAEHAVHLTHTSEVLDASRASIARAEAS